MAIVVAILGSGFMGLTHADAFKELGDRVRVKTVCSRTPERGQRVADSVGATFTSDLDATLSDPEIDLVDVCLPTALHRETAVRSLDGRKHVLLEKPIALTLADAEAIVAAGERSGQCFMVGLVLRFFSEYVELERRVAAGELGRPLEASCYRLSPPADWNTWMHDQAQSGGTAVDLMVHDFDQLNLLFGAPRRVFARAAGGSTGDVLATVEYDGAIGAVEGSMVMPQSYPFSAGIRVLCERGVIEHGFRAAPAEEGGNIGGDIQSFLRVHPVDGAAETVPIDSIDPWRAEIDYLLRCIERRAPVERGTGEQALQALRVSLAANRSLASGQPEAV
jgi:predicted dehydrogenase